MGADFVITQVGFDARKFDELLKFVGREFPAVPVLGNVYILNRPVARVMNRGDVPGCVVTDELFRLIEKEAEASDKGRAARFAEPQGTGLFRDRARAAGPSSLFTETLWLRITKRGSYPVLPRNAPPPPRPIQALIPKTKIKSGQGPHGA